MTKQCNKCKETKDVSEFHKNRTSKDGLCNQCKQCKIAYIKNHYRQNRDKKKAYDKAYHEQNREKRNANHRDWCKRNRKNIRSYSRKYENQRRKTDSKYKFAAYMRNAMNRAFKGTDKPAATSELLGCTLEFAMAHLESQFTEGMSWDNRGEGSVPKGQPYWEVDHIFPLAKVNEKDPDQTRAVCNWRNLQPLWQEDNRAKRDKVTPAARKLFRELCEEFEPQERKVG